VKLLYKPFSLITGLIAARVGKKIFKSMWTWVDDAEKPPKPTAPDASFSKVVGGATLEAATMASVTSAADRATAEAFHYLFGVWPGKPSKEDSDKKSDKKNEKGSEKKSKKRNR
jgi:hypothetical protein